MLWLLPALLACAHPVSPGPPTLHPSAEAASAGLQLRVIDETEFPIPGMHVRVAEVDGDGLWEGTTDAEGIVRLDPPAGTEVLITVTRQFFLPTQVRVVIPESGWSVGWAVELDPAYAEMMVIG